MIIRKLEYLMALAREGHFGRAAEACHVSQPTLSASLRQLEAEMGVIILKRGPRYSGLTEQGDRVLAFAHRMAEIASRTMNLDMRIGTILYREPSPPRSFRERGEGKKMITRRLRADWRWCSHF